MQYERETDRGPDEPLGELRPVDHLPGHAQKWPPVGGDEVEVRSATGWERAYLETTPLGGLWRYEFDSKRVTGSPEWRPVSAEPENPVAAKARHERSRIATAMLELDSHLSRLHSPGAATEAEANALVYVANQLEAAGVLAKIAVKLGQS